MPNYVDFFNRVPADQHFEPSIDTKKLWLSVRHHNHSFPAAHVTGLFSVADYPDDLKMFVVAIALEIIGFFFMISQVHGAFSSLILFIPSVGIVSFFVISDFLCAIKAHKQEKFIVENNLKKDIYDINVALNNATSAEIENRDQLNRKINSYEFKKKIWHALIIGVALLKVLAFFLLMAFKLTPVHFFILLSYVVVAYIHINRTGFFWAAYKLKRKLETEHKEWKGVDANPFFVNHTRTMHIDNNLAIPELNEVETVNFQSLKKAENGYQLKTTGILFDSDIADLCSRQTNTPQKLRLTLICKYHQFYEILNAEAQRAKV